MWTFNLGRTYKQLLFLSHLASRPHIHFYIALFYLHLCVGEIYLRPDTHAQIILVGWAYAQLYTHEMRGRNRKNPSPNPRSKIGQKVEKKNSSLVGGTFFIAGDFSPSPPPFFEILSRGTLDLAFGRTANFPTLSHAKKP